MAKFGQDDTRETEPVGRPDVQYALVATLVGAILCLILLSIVSA